MQTPPTTFAEAEQHNAFSLLRELYQHALSVDAERRKQASFHLAELALSAAVVNWWWRWQPIAMHRALMTGASLEQVAAAAGTSEAEAYGAWAQWADHQTRTMIAGGPAVEPAEVGAIMARLHPNGVSPPGQQ